MFLLVFSISSASVLSILPYRSTTRFTNTSSLTHISGFSQSQHSSHPQAANEPVAFLIGNQGPSQLKEYAT